MKKTSAKERKGRKPQQLQLSWDRTWEKANFGIKIQPAGEENNNISILILVFNLTSCTEFQIICDNPWACKDQSEEFSDNVKFGSSPIVS